eukprot:Gregarina_sp_Pseudo_9__1265@NODE_183_length_3784_cov_24_117757_g169_i0_p1_GENE_NODE_183_length_3784_cov_24_117757_g169_i0NODE_183_length_3784_cov_24_117757_g169_i0_p1_ORF_typecomplete_len1007_score241_85SUR7/PF06687_12/1_9SUR7/PF06687_12/0_054TctB/PF07331_11/12TctB/PF07331_11/0_21TctB/PF07331_11/3_8e02DUF2207/PF09972_9/3_3DUF2207/PF09972_9/1_4DUF1980/PF09323_10/49DUF1980/PF09323_10/6_3e02DUF1980/PF09323_10/17TM_GPCR_Srv/PF10323_9/847TM_GPCR_Srv/PF10323_9/2_6PTPS_related/PF10131_9/2e02PTPS_relate
MGFEQPANLDYSSWRGALEDKVQKACGDDWMFKAPSWTLSEKMFRNLQNSDAAAALEAYMLKEDNLNSYISKRGGFLFMLILCIVLFLVSIAVALAVSRRVRGCFSKVFCGVCRSRDRPRLKQVPSEVRTRLLGVVAGAGIVSLALLIVQIIVSSRMLVDVKKVDCGMWMQLYGHFYGASNLSKDLEHPATANIAWGWRGTQPLLDALAVINQTTNPHNPENDIRVKLYAAYDQLKLDAEAKRLETDKIVDEWIALADAWWGLSTDLSRGDIFNGTWSEFNIGTANAVMYKSKVFKWETQQTLETGWQQMDELLERYAGENSDLLGKAEAATSDSVSTINQMNAVIGALTEKWDSLGPKLIRALRALGALLILLCCAVFFIIPGVAALVMMLRSRMKQDKLPSKKERRFWGYTFIFTVIITGFAALLCGLTFFLIGIGNDVCDLLEDGLFNRGVWGILGDDILSPPGVVDIDVPRILETCILREGDGNVAAALALDARIAELAVEVDRAKEVVLTTRDNLLDRENKLLRIRIVETGAEDIMYTVWRAGMRDDNLVNGVLEKDAEFEYRRTLTDFGVPSPWFDLEWVPEDTSVLLCIIPGTADNSATGAWGLLWHSCQKLGKTGIEIRPVPLNRFYDDLNSQLQLIKNEGGITDAELPSVFCSETGLAQGHVCTPSSPDAVLTKATFQDWPTTYPTGWQNALVSKTYTTDPSWGWKAWRSIVSLGRLEFYMQSMISETNATMADGRILCPLGASDCTVHDAIKATRTMANRDAPRMVRQVEDLFALVDHYVDNVTIGTMSSVIDDAYDVVEGANCQFEGTALNAAAVAPICDAIFPAVAVTCLLMGLLTLSLTVLCRQLWKWFHYTDDLADLHSEDPLKYSDARTSFADMTQRREFVELYKGLPTPEHPGSNNLATPPTEASKFEGTNLTAAPEPQSAPSIPPAEPQPSVSVHAPETQASSALQTQQTQQTRPVGGESSISQSFIVAQDHGAPEPSVSRSSFDTVKP